VEYFSAELSQKVKRGMLLNAEKGLYTGSGVPLGYKIIDKKFAVDDEVASIVKRIFEMYLAGNTMAVIIRYLNENGVKTSKGNSYDKNSIRFILTNDKYIGMYRYSGIEIPNGIPRIIDDTTFEQTQILMEKNKKAPARAKAIEDYYLLTTKLFCGYCNCAMTGVSGTSRNGSIHQYYQCVTNRRKGGCKKKTVQKVYVEDLVVKKVLSALNDDYINEIARKISDLSIKEGTTDTVKRLKRLLKENEEATANLVKAIEQGKAVDVLSAQIEKRQAEKSDLETQIARKKMINPILSYDEVKFFFEKFKNGDVNDITFRTALIDTFVNKIYLYDGENARIEIYCNASDKGIKVPLDKPLKGSSKGQMVQSGGLEPPRSCGH